MQPKSAVPGAQDRFGHCRATEDGSTAPSEILDGAHRLQVGAVGLSLWPGFDSSLLSVQRKKKGYLVPLLLNADSLSQRVRLHCLRTVSASMGYIRPDREAPEGLIAPARRPLGKREPHGDGVVRRGVEVPGIEEDSRWKRTSHIR